MAEVKLVWAGMESVDEVDERAPLEGSLEHRADLSYGDNQSPNLLVHGDNLLALHCLQSRLSGQVKCIYLDPPYNTGMAPGHYNDSRPLSEWLNYMWRRLTLLARFLAPEGLLCVQIGDEGVGYLKVMLDQIFGPQRSVGLVTVRMSHTAGHKRRALGSRVVKNAEYILMYRGCNPLRLKTAYDLCDAYPVNYYQYLVEAVGIPDKKRTVPLTHIVKPHLEKAGLRPNSKNIHVLWANSPAFRQWVIENSHRIGRRDANVPSLPQRPWETLSANEVIRVERGERHYWIGKAATGNPFQFYLLADKVVRRPIGARPDDYLFVDKGDAHSLGGDPMILGDALGDWWDHFYRDMSRVDREGGVPFKNGKKPERLIARILELCTSRGDLVLDAFAGSGTTGAVAHKMGRHWVMIESNPQALTHIIPRMKRLVDGTDSSGITELAKWTGGGGFRVCEILGGQGEQ